VKRIAGRVVWCGLYGGDAVGVGLVAASVVTWLTLASLEEALR